jgi:hypothetical protein
VGTEFPENSYDAGDEAEAAEITQHCMAPKSGIVLIEIWSYDTPDIAPYIIHNKNSFLA